jgi:putative SOS response-associated peptidase YedK
LQHPLMDQQGRPNDRSLSTGGDPGTGKPVEGYLRWGLIPHFPDFAPIHARVETVAENEWFGDAYRKRRCVVPMNSFLQKDGAGKRYTVSRRDGQPFGVAGIWENCRNPLTDMWERTFAVITVPANELVAPIHDRMLAILPTEQFPRWLSEEADPRDLLVPFPEDSLRLSRNTRDARNLANATLPKRPTATLERHHDRSHWNRSCRRWSVRELL